MGWRRPKPPAIRGAGRSDREAVTEEVKMACVKMRQLVEERKIAKAVVKSAIASGYSLGVYDGEEFTIHHSTDAAAVLAEMFTTDESRLFVYKQDGPQGKMDWFGWVLFIYGNDGWDVVNDYTTNLEPVMGKANALADKYGA